LPQKLAFSGPANKAWLHICAFFGATVIKSSRMRGKRHLFLGDVLVIFGFFQHLSLNRHKQQ